VVGDSPWKVHAGDTLFDRMVRETSLIFFYDQMYAKAATLGPALALGFIAMSKYAGWYLSGPITVGSILIVVAVSMLELFVAFLQAYVFTFLTSLFLGLALHPHH
jgi:F0F1-type ATP synthase membrane subunit a